MEENTIFNKNYFDFFSKFGTHITLEEIIIDDKINLKSLGENEKFTFLNTLNPNVPRTRKFFSLSKYRYFWALVNKNSMEVCDVNMGKIYQHTDISKDFLGIELIVKQIDKNKYSDFALYLICLEIKENKKIIKKVKQDFCKHQNLQNNTLRDWINPLTQLLQDHVVLSIVFLLSITFVLVMSSLNELGFPAQTIALELVIYKAKAFLLSLGTVWGFIPIFMIFYILIITSTDDMLCFRLAHIIKTIFPATFFTFAILILSIFVDTVVFKNRNSIADSMVYEYMRDTQLPSIETVKLNGSGRIKPILLMGHKNSILYYYDQDAVKNVLKKVDNRLCEQCSEKQGQVCYFDEISKLLLLSYKDRNASLKNKRINRINIKQVEFIPKKYNFQTAFCNDNNTTSH